MNDCRSWESLEFDLSNHYSFVILKITPFSSSDHTEISAPADLAPSLTFCVFDQYCIRDMKSYSIFMAIAVSSTCGKLPNFSLYNVLSS